MHAGTTDSIASFLASGVTEEGQAVTTLGSTLVLKTLSPRPIYDTSRGIYSHRLGNSWLVGGASNVGCAIFRDESFSDEEINNLTFEMDINNSPFRLYYPLRKVGERFPTNDPEKLPVLEPKPIDENGNLDRKRYLYALFHSIAAIEKEGYELLRSLGVTPIREVSSILMENNDYEFNVLST